MSRALGVALTMALVACDVVVSGEPDAGGEGGGSAAGGSSAGGSAAGRSTAGGSTAGGSTAGGSSAGGSTAGGSTAGGSSAGGSSAGGSSAGGSTAGGSTAGGSSAGGSSAGGSSTANLVTLGVGGDRRYRTTDGNVTIQGNVQDLAPNDADWSDGHTDTMIRGACAGAGKLVTVGGQGDATFRSSTDGLTWTSLVTLNGMMGRPRASWFGDCAFGNGRFVAAGGNGARCFSTDALTWQCPAPYQAFHHRALAFGGGRFVTVGNSYANPATHSSSVSADGASWVEIPSLLNRQANMILYLPAHRRFYAVFGDALGQLRDGETQWTQVAGVDASGVSGMTEKAGTVYLMGQRPMAPYARFLTRSSDGTTWTTSVPGANVEGLHYDPRSDRFMGLRRQYQAGGVSTPYRASSTDAMTWTEVAETMAVHGVSQFVTGELP
ncbi:MAG: hypothetical protein Q8S33_32470 [Myxococcales bacterium]|nr:hypothetical protein [Myxococcales bacterium]